METLQRSDRLKQYGDRADQWTGKLRGREGEKERKKDRVSAHVFMMVIAQCFQENHSRTTKMNRGVDSSIQLWCRNQVFCSGGLTCWDDVHLLLVP